MIPAQYSTASGGESGGSATVRGCLYSSMPAPCSLQVGTSAQLWVAVTLGPAAIRSFEKTQSAFTCPAFQWPMLSLGLLTCDCTWPPVSCTDASLPLLYGM